MPVTQVSVAPNISEEAGITEETHPATSRSTWQRFSSLGIIAVLVVSLAYMLTSVVSNGVIERLVKMVDISGPPPTASGPAARGSSVGMTAEVTRSEPAVPMAGASLAKSPAEGSTVPAQSEVLEEPERTFSVSFTINSDALRTENWNALDSAVVELGRQPDMIVLITDLSQESLGELYDSELYRSRVAAVERYLMAAGVNPRRLHVQEHTALENSDRSALSHIEDNEILNEILYINLETNRSQ